MYTKGHVPSKNERARPQDLLSEGMQTTAQGRQLTSETVGRQAGFNDSSVYHVAAGQWLGHHLPVIRVRV